MHQNLISAMIRYRNNRFIQIVRQTLLILFPVILIGAFAWTIANCLLNPVSLLGRIIHINSWFPDSWFFRAIFGDIFTVTSGMLSLYAAIVSTRVTVEIYDQNSRLAEIFSAINYLLIFHHTIRGSQNVLEMRYYSAYWLIVGILMGYVIGLIFAKIGPKTKQNMNKAELLKLIRLNIKPIALVLVLSIALHIGFALVRTYNLDQLAYQGITEFFNGHSNYWLSILISIITTFLMWLGFAGSLEFNNSVFSNETVINLNHYLTSKSYSNLPYPFTPLNFFNAFTQVGGVGCTLALIIAVILVGKRKRERNVAIWSTFPSIFSANLPLALGFPIILNPVLLIPFILTPIVNMILGSIAIGIDLFPPLVFPVLTGTPGIIYPIVASGGNWTSGLIMLGLLIIDILIYLPFIRFYDQVEEQISVESGRSNEENK